MTIRVINGKRYNTDTAVIVDRTGYGYCGDFGHWCEELYRTPKGAYFLDAEGGPMTKYSVSTGQGEMSGSSGNIIPLSDDEAYDWLEKLGSSDKLEELFFDRITDA